MDIIVAIFVYLGLISPGTTPTEQDVLNHQNELEYYVNDPGFQDFYQQTSSDGIVTMDLDALE